MRKYQAGDVIDFIFASGTPAEQASNSLESDGHEIVAIDKQGISTRVTIRKGN